MLEAAQQGHSVYLHRHLGRDDDLDATERAREYFTGYPPSSPAIALMKDGELVFMLERHEIEGRHPLEIADTLKAAYHEHCSVSQEVP